LYVQATDVEETRMPIQLAVPLEKEFELVKTDKLFGEKDAPPTTVLIRQAAQGEHERRAALFAQIVREQSVDAPEQFIRFIQRFSFEELKRLECFLAVKACNIEDHNGKPLWRFDKNGSITESDFNAGWRKLPLPVAEEIYDCVLDVNVDWRPVVGEEI
jgi:hypothetical protein